MTSEDFHLNFFERMFRSSLEFNLLLLLRRSDCNDFMCSMNGFHDHMHMHVNMTNVDWYLSLQTWQKTTAYPNTKLNRTISSSLINWKKEWFQEFCIRLCASILSFALFWTTNTQYTNERSILNMQIFIHNMVLWHGGPAAWVI